MFPPWCFMLLTIIAFSISSMVMLPTSGRASLGPLAAAFWAVWRKASTVSVSTPASGTVRRSGDEAANVAGPRTGLRHLGGLRDHERRPP
jgi:hypothetical protein